MLLKADHDVATGGNALDASVIGNVETAFGSKFTVPANFMSAGRVLRVRMVMEMITVAGTTTLVTRVRWGGGAGTVIAQSQSTTPGGPQTRTHIAEISIVATAAPGAAVNVHTAVSQSPAVWGNANVTNQPVAVATNADADLVITVQWGAGGTVGNVLKLHSFTVESLNP